MPSLSVSDQHLVDSLNDDIRRLQTENKEAFRERLRLESEKNKIENQLHNNHNRRKEELEQVSNFQYNASPKVFTIKLFMM